MAKSRQQRRNQKAVRRRVRTDRRGSNYNAELAQSQRQTARDDNEQAALVDEMLAMADDHTDVVDGAANVTGE